MTRDVLEKTVRTYKTWELDNLIALHAAHEDGTDNEDMKMMRICEGEKRRREGEDYVDETLDPKFPIRKRLLLLESYVDYAK